MCKFNRSSLCPKLPNTCRASTIIQRLQAILDTACLVHQLVAQSSWHQLACGSAKQVARQHSAAQTEPLRCASNSPSRDNSSPAISGRRSNALSSLASACKQLVARIKRTAQHGDDTKQGRCDARPGQSVQRVRCWAFRHLSASGAQAPPDLTYVQI